MTEMNPAERFAALTEAQAHGARVVAPPQLAEEAALAMGLRQKLRRAPDPAFARVLRAELLAAAGQTIRTAKGAKPMTDQMRIRVAPFEAEFGRIFVAHRNGAVLSAGADADAAAFARSVAAQTGEPPLVEETLPEALRRRIAAHLAGKRRFTDVDLSRLRPFTRRVLEKTAEIPRGQVRPYGWIAREIGAPGAVRAVGTALGQNPIPFIIPCHRVVRSDGRLGEYSGGGPAVKARVLESEGVATAPLLAGRGGEMVGCRSTHIFCYPTCHAAKRVRPENQLPFRSGSAAAAAGFRPCRLCRPA